MKKTILLTVLFIIIGYVCYDASVAASIVHQDPVNVQIVLSIVWLIVGMILLYSVCQYKQIRRTDLILRMIGFAIYIILIMLIPFMSSHIKTMIWTLLMILLCGRLGYRIYQYMRSNCHKNKQG